MKASRSVTSTSSVTAIKTCDKVKVLVSVVVVTEMLEEAVLVLTLVRVEELVVELSVVKDV
jgi:hypothetical protein